MSGADWRSADDYERHHASGREAFAWEIVRRNEAYRRDYERLASEALTDAAEQERFADRWGLRFGADPALDFDQQPVFWLPQVLPTVLQLQPIGADLAFDPIDLTAFLSRTSHDQGAIIQHFLSFRDASHQLWIAGAPSGIMAVVLPLDHLFERRNAAALRLWRQLQGLPPGADPLPLSRYACNQLILVLRLLDAEHSGASERDMARYVLGRIAESRRDWLASETRSRLRRLLRRRTR